MGSSDLSVGAGWPTSWLLHPVGTQVLATGISAVVVKENTSDVLEVRLGGLDGRAFEVLLNQEMLNFSEQTWLDLKGETPGKEEALPGPWEGILSLPHLQDPTSSEARKDGIARSGAGTAGTPEQGAQISADILPWPRLPMSGHQPSES